MTRHDPDKNPSTRSPVSNASTQSYPSRRVRRLQQDALETVAHPEFGTRRARREASKSNDGAPAQSAPTIHPATGNATIDGRKAAADQAATERSQLSALDDQQYPSRRSRRLVLPAHVAEEEPAGTIDAPEATTHSPGIPATSTTVSPTGAGSFEAIISGADDGPTVGDTGSSEPEETLGAAFSPGKRASTKVTGPTLKAPRPLRRLAKTTMSISAALAVSLMTVATSVPANALLSEDEVHTSKHVTLQSERGTDDSGAQSMVSTSAEIPVNRDTYGAQSAPETASQSGIRPEDTFTNDPNSAVQWPFPAGVHIGSGYGPRPGCAIGCSTNHLGQDFNPGYGAPIQSIADGVVIKSTDAGGNFGVKIVIEHTIDGRTVRSLYAHMMPGSRTIQVGDHVSSGQIIGKTGNTGISTGPHLHLEITINGRGNVDPLAWLNKNTN